MLEKILLTLFILICIIGCILIVLPVTAAANIANVLIITFTFLILSITFIAIKII